MYIDVLLLFIRIYMHVCGVYVLSDLYVCLSMFLYDIIYIFIMHVYVYSPHSHNPPAGAWG